MSILTPFFRMPLTIFRIVTRLYFAICFMTGSWGMLSSGSPSSLQAQALPDSLKQQLASLENPKERQVWLRAKISKYTSQTPPIAHACMLILADEIEQTATRLDSGKALQLRGAAAFMVGEGLKAFEMSHESACMLEGLGDSLELARSYFYLALSAAVGLEDQSAGLIYNQLGLQNCPKDNYTLKGSLRSNLTASLLNTGQIEKAITAIQEGISEIERIDINDQTEKAQQDWMWLHNNLGSAYGKSGQLKKSLEAYQRVLAFARKHGNNRTIRAATQGICGTLLDLEAPTQALLYLHEAEEAFQDFGATYAMAGFYNTRAAVHLMLDSLDIAEEDLKQMAKYMEQHQQTELLPRMQIREVQLWSKRGQIGKAIELAEAYLTSPRTLKLEERLTFELLILENYLLLASEKQDYTGEGKLESFSPPIPSISTLEAVADTLIPLALEAKMFKDLKHIYEALGKFYQFQEDAPKALEMNRMVSVMADSILPASEFEQLKASTFEFEMQQKDKSLQQQQIRLQRQKNQLRHQRQRTYWLFSLVGTLVLLILTGGGFLYGRMKLNQRLRATNQQLRGANTQIQEQSAIILAQKEALQEELGTRERELASREVLRHRNEQLLETLEKDLKDIAAYITPEGRSLVKNAREKLRQVPRSTRDWEVFREQFERIHPTFFQNLTHHHPQLTAVDLRQCAYIRLGMDKREMANLLNLTIRGVESARYRIRKKMELEKGQSLDQYLQSL